MAITIAASSTGRAPQRAAARDHQRRGQCGGQKKRTEAAPPTGRLQAVFDIRTGKQGR